MKVHLRIVVLSLHLHCLVIVDVFGFRFCEMFFVVDSRILLVLFCCIRVTCVFFNVLRLKRVVSAMHHNLFDALF